MKISPIGRLWIFILCLASLNLYFCHDLLHITYLDNLDSNEGDLVTVARFYSLHPTAKWFPYWSAGLPVEHTYSPFVPALTALVAVAAHTAIPLALHRIIVFFYCLGPVLWMSLAFQCTGAPIKAFAGALTYSLVSPIALLSPNLRTDLTHWYDTRRLWEVVHYADIAHMISLCFLSLAVMFLLRVCRSGSALDSCLAILAASLTILADGFGMTAIGLSCIALLASGPLRSLWKSSLRIGLVASVTYAVVSPFLTLRLLQTISTNAQITEGDYRFSATTPLLWVLLLGLAVASTRLPHRHFFLRFLTASTILFAGVVLLPNLVRVNLIPMPHRLELEGDVAMSFLLVELAALLPSQTRVGISAVALVIAMALALAERRFTQTFLRPVEMLKTPEFKAAQWIRTNRPKQRAMVSGDADFWFNYFTDNPQLSASHVPFSPNPVQQFAVFTIYTGTNAGKRDAAISILWLKAFGATSILVPQPNSREPTHPYSNPAKFEGVLPRLYETDGDVIYEVPSRSVSLAHVVPAEALVSHRPIHGLDVDAVQTYVAALEEARLPLATMDWKSTDEAEITGSTGPGQVISVQETFYPGWTATSNDSPLPVGTDGLGLIVIRPPVSGAFTIKLKYVGSAFRNWALAASAMTLVLLLAVVGSLIFGGRRKD